MTESNTEFVQHLYEASARGDTEAFFAALSDDIEWHEAEGGPYGGVHRGPDEVAVRVFGPLAEDVPDFAVSVERVLPSGNAVAVAATPVRDGLPARRWTSLWCTSGTFTRARS